MNIIKLITKNRAVFITVSVVGGIFVLFGGAAVYRGVSKAIAPKPKLITNFGEKSLEGKPELTAFEEDQVRLIKRYGDPGKGYYWSDEGTRMALGDVNLTDTEVAYTFLRSISTLDFAEAQKYAYKDQVLRTVTTYFSSDADFTYDESFKKSMYQEVLLSLEPLGIENNATFADNRGNVSMRVKVLDLSYKDFWQDDSEEIFETIRKYRRTERDSTKARNYLYNYVLDYWKSEQAVKTEVTINLTLMKTREGGWLVNKDTDLDNYAKYVDGETVVNNIMLEFDDWLQDQEN